MGKRGQPKIGEDFEILVYIKIVQYCNRYNIGPMKAWEKLTTHKAFPELMKNWHGKTRSVITNNYIERLQENLCEKLSKPEFHFKASDLGL